MKKILLLLFIPFIVAASIQNMQKAVIAKKNTVGGESCSIVSQENQDTTLGNALYGTNYGYGQAWVAPQSGTTVKVTFKVSSITGNPGDSYIKIDNDEDMSVEYDCASSAFDISATGDHQETITGCNITKSETYHFQIRHTGGDSNNKYYIRYQANTDPYGPSDARESYGDWILDLNVGTGDDLYFIVEVCD